MDNTETPCYTGGSGVCDLLRKLFQASTIAEQGAAPKTLKRGNDFKEHLRRIEEHVKLLEFKDDKIKCAVLLNSLEESIQYELFSFMDYSNNSSYARRGRACEF